MIVRLNLQPPFFKAGFHMIADDRGSQIADDRKESCFHIIADDRKRSQSRLLHTFRTAEVSKLNARSASEKIAANNMAYVEGEKLLQANFFFFYSTDFEILLAHLAPRQKVAFSIALKTTIYTQFLCCGI